MDKKDSDDSPFEAILRNDKYGEIITRDDAKRFAIISSMEPEAAIHWLAIPFESGVSTEEMKRDDSSRFLDLVAYALSETRALADNYPALTNGFTIKFHVGSFETVTHPKLHILSAE
jgi:histidine triad (HIT) family protein